MHYRRDVAHNAMVVCVRCNVILTEFSLKLVEFVTYYSL